jgi:hypothetical protein
MRRTTILNAAEVKKTSYKETQSSYFKRMVTRVQYSGLTMRPSK